MVTYQDAVLADSPIAYWRLDDSVGADLSGYGRALMFSGPLDYLQPSLLAGDSGHSIGFPDNPAAFAWISANDGWMDRSDMAPSFTIEAIIRPDAVDGIRDIVGRWYSEPTDPTSTSRQRWVLRINDGVLEFLFRGSEGTDGLARAFVDPDFYPLLVPGETHHVLVSYDNQFRGIQHHDIYLYLDGQFIGAAQQTPSSQNQHLFIGTDGNFEQDAFDGLIDEVAYYDYPMVTASDERVVAHYDLMVNGPSFEPPHLTPAQIAATGVRGSFSYGRLYTSQVQVSGLRGYFQGPGEQRALNPAEIGVDGLTGVWDLPPEIVVTILDPEVEEAPSILTVLVSMAPEGPVIFSIGGEQVWADETDETGIVGPLSIPVPEGLTAGTYDLDVTASAATGSDEFTIAHDPSALPDDTAPDADPVVVPDSEGRWVLQDLAPGGLGSWIMHPNPASYAPIPKTRNLQAAGTTYAGGKIHVTEGKTYALDWQFAGYCPDKAYYDKLVAFGNLNRRCYVHTHRGVLVVAFLGPDLVPRKRQIGDDGNWNDWAHDFTMRCLVYGSA